MDTPIKRKASTQDVKEVPPAEKSTKKVGPAGKMTIPKLGEGQIFVHNTVCGTFHAPLNNPNPKAEEQPIKFELNEVRKLDGALFKEQRFVDAVELGFLEQFTPEEYETFLKKQSLVKSNETRKAAIGNHKSGLPNNRTMALQQIQMIDDADTLQALYDEETRGSIMAAIEERLGELADSTFES